MSVTTEDQVIPESCLNKVKISPANIKVTFMFYYKRTTSGNIPTYRIYIYTQLMIIRFKRLRKPANLWPGLAPTTSRHKSQVPHRLLDLINHQHISTTQKWLQSEVPKHGFYLEIVGVIHSQFGKSQRCNPGAAAILTM